MPGPTARPGWSLYFFDDFEDPAASAARWSHLGGASLPVGYDGKGWDVSLGAGGEATPEFWLDVPLAKQVRHALVDFRFYLGASNVGADWIVFYAGAQFALQTSWTGSGINWVVAGANAGTTPIAQDAWHHAEVELLEDVAGFLHVTLDDVLALDYNGDTRRTTGMDRYDFSIVGGATYFDEVAIWHPGRPGFLVGSVA
jgi:hypothetical protein